MSIQIFDNAVGHQDHFVSSNIQPANIPPAGFLFLGTMNFLRSPWLILLSLAAMLALADQSLGI